MKVSFTSSCLVPSGYEKRAQEYLSQDLKDIVDQEVEPVFQVTPVENGEEFSLLDIPEPIWEELPEDVQEAIEDGAAE